MTRQPQPGEIENTIAEAVRTAGAKRRISPSFGRSRSLGLNRPKWPAASAAKMQEIFLRFSGISIENWEALSDSRITQERILQWAFCSAEFICYGSHRRILVGERIADYWDIRTQRRAAAIWHGKNAQYIVPNPFKALTGLTKAGKPTNKSDVQVLLRRFLVVEFDFRSFEWTRDLGTAEKLDYQARLHWHLAFTYPLTLLVYSGNESLHGWYATLWPRELMRDAAALGADTKLWTLSQFTRMPAGRHSNGQRQRVVFFKPQRLNSRFYDKQDSQG